MGAQNTSQTLLGASGATTADVAVIVTALDRLADRARRIAPDTSALLSSLAGRLEAQTMSLAFMGRFSSGKSSLINCALGQPLLPVDDLPETGLPCYLRPGVQDQVVVTGRDGARRTAPCTTEAIAELVSLRTAAGDVNTVIDEVDRVDIDLRGFSHEDMVWIDAPGISSGDESAFAEVVSNDADLVVWVLGSRQFLSKSEAQGIADHVARCGPESVALVLNVHLQEFGAPLDQAWERALARLPDWRTRMGDMWAEVGLDRAWSPPLIMVSAMEGLRDSSGFGAPALKDLLASVRAPTCPSALSIRLARASHRLGLAKVSLLESLVTAQALNEARRADLAKHEEKTRRERNAVERKVKDALTAFNAGFAARASTIGGTFRDEIRSYDIGRTDDLSAMLTARLESAARAERSALKSTLDAIAGLKGDFGIDQALAVPQLAVAYADNPVESSAGTTGAAAAAGAVVGSLIVPVPVLGAVLGAAIGGMFGKSQGQDRARDAAIELDKAQTCETVTRETNRAVARLKDQSEALTEAVMRSFRAPASPPPRPDAKREEELVVLLNSINELAAQVAAARKLRQATVIGA